MIISPDSSVHSMPHVAEPSHTTMDFRETKEPALNLGLFILTIINSNNIISITQCSLQCRELVYSWIKYYHDAH